MLWIENIQIALRNLRANKGRASLTILIIAVGVMALVAILTSLDILIFSLSDNFSRLGANSFSIEPSSQVIQTSDGGRMRKRGEPIKYDQAIDFKGSFKQIADKKFKYIFEDYESGHKSESIYRMIIIQK